MKLHDVVIVGAGPAGIAAAIQLRRQGITPLLIERDTPGGLLRNADRVENYPGFAEGIAGPRLAALLRKHLARAGVEPVQEAVESLEYDGAAFHFRTAAGEHTGRIAVIATGTRPREVSFPGLDAALGVRAFYEVHPLLPLGGKRVSIVGAGDAAFDYALNLARRGNRVTIHNRGGRRSCLPLLWERAAANEDIEYRVDSTLLNIETGGECLSLSWRDEERDVRESCDYLLLATGREANLGFLSGSMRPRVRDLQAAGLLHLIGDVQNGPFRQAAIAAGDGIRAAMMVSRKLDESK